MGCAAREMGVLCALVLLSGACGDTAKPPSAPIVLRDACSSQPDGLVCEGTRALRCVAGKTESAEDCAGDGLRCELPHGCIRCTPQSFDCMDNAFARCTADGLELDVIKVCAEGQQCSAAGCSDLCAVAEANKSYVGCEYFPVFTSNSQLDPVFAPAIVVANPNLVPATVRVEGGPGDVVERVIPRESVEVFELDYDPALRNSGAALPASRLVPGGAYHVVSNVPLTVHQFNPLLYQRNDTDCVGPVDIATSDERCNSFTNDASLLLPVHALADDYIAVSRPSFMQLDALTDAWVGLPGFVTLVGVQKEPVTARIRTSAYATWEHDGQLERFAPGDELSVTLGQGDVFQLVNDVPTTCDGELGSFGGAQRPLTTCDPGPDFDLTGTQIDADGPLQALSGHDCAYVPFNVPACDHLEEALFPIQTWGSQVVVTRPRALDAEKHVFRVVSGDDDNLIRFDPEVHPPVTLARSQSIEIETTEHVFVNGQKRIMVAQFLVGQGASLRDGDPAMGLAIPVDQYRSTYVFLAPDTYSDRFVNLIAGKNARVMLNGELVEGFEDVGQSGFTVATERLTVSGQHRVEGVNGTSVGLILYGYAPYTSYMLPAGLDLTAIGSPL